MYVSARFLLLWVLLGAAFFSPVAVGAFDGFPYAPVAVALFVFAAYTFGPAHDRLSKQVVLSGRAARRKMSCDTRTSRA
jgi:hypothetical protein